MALPEYNALDYQEPDFQNLGEFLSIQGRPLRPFVNIWIPATDNMKPGGGAETSWVIDDALNKRTEKFQYLKSFRFSMFGGGESVRITLFDDTGFLWETLTTFYYAFEGDKIDLGNKSRYHIGFRFGWAHFGLGDMTGQAGNRYEISSAWHKLVLSDMDVQIVDGGYAFQLTGTDAMAVLQQATVGSVYADTTLMVFMDQLLEYDPQRQCPKIGAPVYIDSIGNLLDKKSQNGPDDTPRTWQCTCRDTLTITTDAIGMAGTKDLEPLKHQWDSHLNRLVIGPHSKGTIYEPYLRGPHLVNTWSEKGYTGTAIKRFEPKLSGLAMLSMGYQTGKLLAMERIQIKTTEDDAAKNIADNESAKLGQGSNVVSEPTRQKDDPYNDLRVALVKQKTKGVKLNTDATSTMFTADAELEMVGWPKSDIGFLTVGRCIELIVWQPYNISWAETASQYAGYLKWQSDGIDERLSGIWLIQKLEHVIDESVGYSMIMNISRIRNPDSEPFSPEKTG